MIGETAADDPDDQGCLIGSEKVIGLIGETDDGGDDQGPTTRQTQQLSQVKRSFKLKVRNSKATKAFGPSDRSIDRSPLGLGKVEANRIEGMIRWEQMVEEGREGDQDPQNGFDQGSGYQEE